MSVADPLAAWRRLDDRERAACERAIARLVDAKLRSDEPAYYPGATPDDASTTVTVYAAEEDSYMGEVKACFVADRLAYPFPSSLGAIEQYLFVGSATFTVERWREAAIADYLGT